jgi:hypothetical protein
MLFRRRQSQVETVTPKWQKEAAQRRRSRWALRSMREPSEGEAVDASRFVKEADLCAGLGRKPVKE